MRRFLLAPISGVERTTWHDARPDNAATKEAEMAGTITDPVDNLTAHKNEGGTGAPADADNANEPYLGTWGDREAAEKGVNELHGAKTRVDQENADLRRQLADRKTLEGLAETVAKGSGLTEEQVAAHRQNVIKDFDGDEGAAATLDFILGANAELESKIKNARGEELKEFKEDLEQIKSALSEIRETSSPEYQKQKDYIDEIQEETGCSREGAMAYAKKHPQSPVIPDGDTPPGGTGTNRVQGSPPEKPATTDEQKGQLRDRFGLTEEEVKTAR